MFASRWLNTQLFNIGFAESYNEVACFKQGMVMTEDIGDILQSHASEDCSITFVGDNVDHNTATLDEKGTFHEMGIIASITNKVNFINKKPLRLRPKSYTRVHKLARKKGIHITSEDFTLYCGLDNIIFKSYKNMPSFTNRMSLDMDCL